MPRSLNLPADHFAADLPAVCYLMPDGTLVRVDDIASQLDFEELEFAHDGAAVAVDVRVSRGFQPPWDDEDDDDL